MSGDPTRDRSISEPNQQSASHILPKASLTPAETPGTSKTSTPSRLSSKQVVSNLSIQSVAKSRPTRSQQELKRDMSEEIGSQTFEFSSLELSRILSPKTLKDGVETGTRLIPISDYNCVVDEDTFDKALRHVVEGLETYNIKSAGSTEESSYSVLAPLLTKFVARCHAALDESNDFPPAHKRWYDKLEFVVAKQVADGIEGAAPLKPDIVGAKGTSEHGLGEQRFCWDPQAVAKPCQRVLIPVEVKSDWRELVSQAATYARGLFSAIPMRMFALVLGFDHTKHGLRFLVFHRGGLAASEEYNISQKDGMEHVARLFLTLTLWTTAEEAGFIPCCNETGYLLPADKKEKYVYAKVEAALFRSLCVRGRMTHVLLLGLPPPKGAAPADSRPPVRETQNPVAFTTTHRRSTRIATHAKGKPRRPSAAKSTTRSKHSSNRVTSLPKASITAHGELSNAGPDSRLKYIPPNKIFRGNDDPPLSSLTGTVVIKTSWPGIDRRDSEANMFLDSSGRFGVMPHVCSYEPSGKNGEVISNILFFPEEGEIEAHYWNVFGLPMPQRLDIRTYKQTILASCGEKFTEAESPQKLTHAFAHSLLGWLSVYTSGHLQRDPSLGNLLTIPAAKKEFEIPKEFLDGLSGPAAEGIKKQCKEVETLVAKLGISNEHSAVITDGDLSISWRNYWKDESRAAKSGTPEFMSRALLTAEEGEHLHSPVDDLESFFWVAFWSILFNKKSGFPTEAEKRIMDHLGKNNRAYALDRFLLLPPKYQGNITNRFQAFVEDWWNKVLDRQLVWAHKVVRPAPVDAGYEYYMPHFHQFALQGVLDVLRVLQKHWKGEINWESWGGPTPST